MYPEDLGAKLQDPAARSELRVILFVATGLLNPTSFCNKLGLVLTVYGVAWSFFSICKFLISQSMPVPTSPKIGACIIQLSSDELLLLRKVIVVL